MTKNLSQIDELKWAIDALDTQAKAEAILAKFGLLHQGLPLNATLIIARHALEQLKNAKTQ